MLARKQTAKKNRPLPGRRERKKQTTRDAIFRVAQELFKKRGFENTSVEEITERVDIAQSTFFNYFSRKEDILQEILQRQMPQLNKKCLAILHSDAPVKVQIHRTFAALLDVVKRNENIVRAMIVNTISSPPDRPYSVPLFREFQECLMHILENGRQTGVLRQDIPARRMAFTLEGVFTVCVIDCLIKKFYPLSSNELFERLNICLDGMLAR